MTGVLIRSNEDTDTHRGTTVGGHGEQVAVRAPRRGAAEGTNPACISISEFRPPKL